MLSDPPLYYNDNQWMALDAFRWLTDRMNTSGALESEEDIRVHLVDATEPTFDFFISQPALWNSKKA
jgi:hypothetical protein